MSLVDPGHLAGWSFPADLEDPATLAADALSPADAARHLCAHHRGRPGDVGLSAAELARIADRLEQLLAPVHQTDDEGRVVVPLDVLLSGEPTIADAVRACF